MALGRKQTGLICSSLPSSRLLSVRASYHRVDTRHAVIPGVRVILTPLRSRRLLSLMYSSSQPSKLVANGYCTSRAHAHAHASARLLHAKMVRWRTVHRLNGN
jgi:hypothetical protein